MLAKFAVPMFIFISGLVLFYRYREGKVPYISFLRKRFKDIVFPYLPWAPLYIWVEADFFAGGFISLGEWGRQVLTGKASYHLWYVVMIFQFYLLFPLFQAAILWLNRKSPGRVLWGTVLALGAAYVWLTGKVYPIGEWTGSLGIPWITAYFGEYADRNVLYFYYYFVMGAFAGLHLDRFKSLMHRYTRFWIGVFALLLLWTGYRIVEHFEYRPELKIQYNDTPLLQPSMAVVLIFSIPAMYVFALALDRYMPAFWKKTLTVIGSYSYVAYLAHALMLTAAVYVTDGLLYFMNPTLRTLAAFILCTLLSVAAAAGLRRMRSAAGLLIPGAARRQEGRSAAR
ncbi:acyltransferase [Paenibacillus sp. P25]|nr:acyltransferase [Paenibacillus sp. P25]